jgi:hypothetical protein
MYFVTHPVLKLDPASRLGPALGTAIDGFIQIVFFGRLQRDSRHHDSTVRTGHKPDGTAGTTVPVALGLGTFCQRHALLRNQTTRQERVICSQKAAPCARGRATWHAGGSCGQMLGVKEQPDKRWLISVGHAVLCAGLWPGHGTRLTSPQKPQGGAVLRAAHGEVGCLPVPPRASMAHVRPKDHLRRDARRWRSRSLDLLLRFPAQPLDRDQRRPMAGWRSAV